MTREEAIKYVKENLLDEKYRIEALETLIPELKKSEDEVMIEILQNCVNVNSEWTWVLDYYKKTKDDVMSWLKKQGNQSNIQWHDVNEEPKEGREVFCEWETNDATWHDVAFYHADNKSFWSVRRKLGNVVKWIYVDEILKKKSDNTVESTKKFIRDYGNWDYDKSQSKKGKTALEAINEKTVDNTNKVKSKFKVGDWLACDNLNTVLILTVENGNYVIESTDGTKGLPSIDYIDRLFHLWTLQDAKDGDILADEDGAFIFKGLLDPNSPGCPVAYGGLDCVGNFMVGSGSMNEIYSWCLSEEVKPATKEQKDILFKKMNEKGYIWVNDKKELMHIDSTEEKK